MARKYHHGDLKATLVRGALDRVARRGLEGLTLRAVARQAGVSSAAPYHHWDSLEALLDAAAEAVVERLAQAVDEAVAPLGSSDLGARIKAASEASARFVDARGPWMQLANQQASAGRGAGPPRGWWDPWRGAWMRAAGVRSDLPGLDQKLNLLWRAVQSVCLQRGPASGPGPAGISCMQALEAELDGWLSVLGLTEAAWKATAASAAV